MENRRDFFKALGIFAAGVVGAKVASYVPKKQEEDILVSNQITITGPDGKEYHPVVVARTKADKTPVESKETKMGDYMTIHSSAPKNQVRKLNI